MEKQVLIILAMIGLFLISCNDTSQSRRSIETAKAEKTRRDDIIIATNLDKKGNKLEVTFNNTKNTAILKLNGETIELVADNTMASGIHYKNEHYNYTNWHKITKVEKDGEIIFEVSE